MRTEIVILGSGESGTGAAILAKRLGYSVFVSDGGKIKDVHKKILREHDISFEEGAHSTNRIASASEVIKSPGILSMSPIVKMCRERGIPLIDEVEFAFRHKGDSKIISVTGSNGKTTVASMIYHIVKAQTDNVALVGNIGNSFAKQVAMDKKSIYIVELSSFQLDYIQSYKSDISVLLNITPDHLNAYEYKMENYIASKFSIIKNATSGDYFVYCADDKNIVSYMKDHPTKSLCIPFSLQDKELHPGAYIKNNQIILNVKEETMNIPLSDIPLIGKHNQSNTMAAAIATKALGIRKEYIQKAIQSFQAVDHRMEYAGTFGGITFINDSKATNINSTWYALESMTKPVVLILGGQDKGNDYTDIDDLVKQKVKAIVCLGVNNDKILSHFEGKVGAMVETKSMQEAVRKATAFAKQGDTVLLSPACASFDLFDNYEDRGNQFKTAVMNL